MKKQKTLNRLAVALAVLLALALVFVAPVGAVTWQGAGTDESPFEISSLDHLIEMRDAVNSGGTIGSVAAGTASYKLTADIDLKDIEWYPISNKTTQNQVSYFSGNFDGNNKVIYNLEITDGGSIIGFFGHLNKGNSAKITNLILENVHLHGDKWVGAVAGYAQNIELIQNCHVRGSVIIEGYNNVGGITGQIYKGDISDCTVIGDNNSHVKGYYETDDNDGTKIGGIVGHGGDDKLVVTNCKTDIAVSGTRGVGGLLGYINSGNSESQILSCSSSGIVTLTYTVDTYTEYTVENKANAGALIGEFGSGSKATITSCVSTSEVIVDDKFTSTTPVSVGFIGGTRGDSWNLPERVDVVSELITSSVWAVSQEHYNGLVSAGYLKVPSLSPLAVAKIESGEVVKYYTSIKDAVAAVPVGTETTITLLADTKDSFDVGNSAGTNAKKIILDLNANTLTVGPGIGSSGTETNGIRVLYNSELEIKNGVIKTSDVEDDKVKVTIANYGILKITDVTVNSGALVGWTINNRGDLTLSGTTTVENGKVSPYWSVTNDPYNYIVTDRDAILRIADDKVTVGTVSVELYGNEQNAGTVDLQISAGSIGKVIDDGATAIIPEKSITGGTYDEAVDSKFIKEGYKAVLSGGKYIVAEASSLLPEFTATNVGFDSVKVGYTQPEAKIVTVENTGKMDLTIKEIKSKNFIIGEPSSKKVVSGGEPVTFTIQPKADLPVGNYEEDIEVITEEEAIAIFTVSFLVYQPSSGGSSKPVEEPEEPVVEPEVPTEEPEAGEATVETEVTDGGEVELETPTADGSAAAYEDEAKITGVVLPTGTDSEVTFVPVSEQAAPAGKETQTKKVFEINVPTYEKGKAAVIKFTMTVAELAADGKEAADVALWHFDEETGEWTKLVTSYTIVDGVVYFEAITNDFSPFAIVYEDEPVDEPVDEPETPESPAPVLGLIAALGAAVALRRK